MPSFQYSSKKLCGVDSVTLFSILYEKNSALALDQKLHVAPNNKPTNLPGSTYEPYASVGKIGSLWIIILGIGVVMNIQ